MSVSEMPILKNRLNIATIQWNIINGNAQANISKIKDLIDKYVKGKAELVVLPEMCVSGFCFEKLAEEAKKNKEILAAMTEIAKLHNIWLCFSQAEPVDEINSKLEDYSKNCTHKVYNTLYLLDSGGNIRLKYRKIHLFPLTPEPEYFVAGNELPKPCNVGDWKIGCGICYDLRFPELFRIQAKWGANLFLVPSQFPKARHSAFRFLSQARGLDAQAYVVSCNRVGVDGKLEFIGGSLICDYLGNILAEDSSEESACICSISANEVEDNRKKFPFLSYLPLLPE